MFFAPFFNFTRLFNVLVIATLFYFLWYFGGAPEVLGELSESLLGMLSFLSSILLYLLLCLFISMFSVFKKEKQIGQWVDNNFIYHEPLHVKTFFVSPEDGGKCRRFVVEGVPSNCFAYFKVEYEKGHGLIVIKTHENQPLVNGLTRETQYGVRLNQNSETVAELVIEKNSVPTIAKLSVLYWVIENL